MNIDDHDTHDDHDCCDVCGERLYENSEIGEFVNNIGKGEEHVIAHVQCGLDANMETA